MAAFFIGGLCFLTLPLSARSDQAGKAQGLQLSVEVIQLRNNKGNVAVALFDNADSFPDQQKALKGFLTRPKGKRARVEFRGIKPGVYAIAVLHDENKNNKMDFNFVGMPQEGYGFSNDAPVTFGPPSYKAAAVRVVKPRSAIKVKARYFSL